MSLNLSEPLREAILGMYTVTDLLGTYGNEPSIFTRRPVPGEATYPMVVISPDAAVFNQDALVSFRPVVLRDLAVYGQENATRNGTQVSDYRTVETIAYDLRERFHRRRDVIFFPDDDYHVIDVVAAGPLVAPTGDDRLIGRVVPLTIRLLKKG